MSHKRHPIVVNKFSWLFAVALAFCIQLPAQAQSCANYRWKTVTGVGTTTGQVPETVAYESMLPYYVIGHPNVTLNPFSCSLQSGNVNLGTGLMYCTSTYVCGPPSCTATQTGGVETNVWQDACPADFYVSSDSDPPCQDGNCVADPIIVESGAVVVREEDIPASASGLKFYRYYNSRILGTAGLSPGWSHSYSRRIVARNTQPVYRPYSVGGGGNSGLYTDSASACSSGFAQIRGRISNWSTGVASFSGGTCSVSVGGSAVGTITVRSAVPVDLDPGATILGYDAIRDDGKTVRFTADAGVYNPPKGVTLQLVIIAGGYKITDENEVVETYNTNGSLVSVRVPGVGTQTAAYDAAFRLASVSDESGHVLSLTRDAASRIATVTDSGGRVTTLGYDTLQQLASVDHGDGTSRTYAYQNAGLPNALSGINDENSTRLSSWTYDSDARGTESHESTNINSHTLAYNTDGSVTVTDALGAVRTFQSVRIGDRYLSSAISGSQCPTCKDGASTTYDAAGFVASRRDYIGNLTCYANDVVRGLETTRVEGFSPSTISCPVNLASYSPVAGTRERKFATVWHSTFRKPTSIVEANRTTTFTHDVAGNVLTRTLTDTSITPNVARTWTYTFNTAGKVLTDNGPRSDVTDLTTYSYYTCTTGYQCGQLNTITNAAGHITTYNSYNAHGQPTQITDPNGLVTTLGYDARQRMTDRCVGATLPACTGGELTHLDYWPTGLLKKVTNPDASYIQYTYDNAHRLTQINDGALNKIVYTLDNAGNRTAENSYDPSNLLKRTHSRVFNTLNQLWKDVNAAGTVNVTTVFGYDNNGNPTTTNAPLSRNSTNIYDELNRLKQITDPNSGNTLFGYDANDNLTSITDPRTLATTYAYNGFGDLKTQTSPDTGLTTNTYDSGGNLKTSTDARSAISTYTYDAMNRVATVAYKIGTTTDQTITYTYDGGVNLKGRLTGASDTNHSLAWTYDTKGRVTGKAQTVTGATPPLSVGYGYNALGQLFHIVMPSGKAFTYGYNSNGQVSSVSLDSPSTAILTSVTYDPFGPITGWAWGNGSTSTSRTFDTDGKLTGVSSTASTVGNRTFGYDDAFRITSTTDSVSGGPNWTLGYDILDRLNSATKTGTTIGHTYDANGNRLTQTGTTASTYTVASTSNKLSSTSGGLVRTFSYNLSGSVLTSGATTHTYYNSGRMATGKLGAAGVTTYIYNALGQRVKKSGGAITTPVYFVYDEAGHLIGEYTISGSTVTTLQETVWLGDIPIATVRPISGVTTVFYVHTDQLNTPRKITSAANVLQWKWDPTPFGEGTPSEPAGTFKYNLRFPGQYFDLETNLNYNYFRDYDPAKGGYVESDPIGLRGGINTYGYARMRPGQLVDMLGLSAADVTNVVNNVNDNFPEIHTNGGWQFGTPDSGSSAHTNPSTGRITIDQLYKKECLTEDEFYSLYFDYLHEAMHSTDPSGTRKQDAFMQNWFGVTTSNHQSIYNRGAYEELGAFPKGFEKDGLWGYGPTSNIRQPISPKVKKLYEETRSCECKKQ